MFDEEFARSWTEIRFTSGHWNNLIFGEEPARSCAEIKVYKITNHKKFTSGYKNDLIFDKKIYNKLYRNRCPWVVTEIIYIWQKIYNKLYGNTSLQVLVKNSIWYRSGGLGC
jgi:hypothetical protein